MKEVCMAFPIFLQQEPEPGPEALVVRKARLSDVEAIHQLINSFASQGVMLPKTLLQLYENIRDYTVASDASGFGGCGSLHIYWENLAEIRALAVAPETSHRGIGTLLVKALIEEARSLGISRVFLFTYVPDFFSRFGFAKTEHSSMPLKVFNECFQCPKFNTCDEIAMVMDL
jgi:amino-acid N-acetyltransferase